MGEIIAYSRNIYELTQVAQGKFECKCIEYDDVFDMQYIIRFDVVENIVRVTSSPFDIPHDVVTMLNRIGYIVYDKVNNKLGVL